MLLLLWSYHNKNIEYVQRRIIFSKIKAFFQEAIWFLKILNIFTSYSFRESYLDRWVSVWQRVSVLNVWLDPTFMLFLTFLKILTNYLIPVTSSFSLFWQGNWKHFVFLTNYRKKLETLPFQWKQNFYPY